MTDTEIQKACAELDGWNQCTIRTTRWHKDGRVEEDVFLPRYLTSYDAVIPLIRKMNPHLRNEFISILWKLTGNEVSVNFWTEYNFRGLFAMLVATPRQLCEALLRAVGKWRAQEIG